MFFKKQNVHLYIEKLCGNKDKLPKIFNPGILNPL